MAVDTGNGEALAALFTPDGDFELLSPIVPAQNLQGR
jgi:hypothetical protein